MRLKFKVKDFQTIAADTVCDLFRGQEKRAGKFTRKKLAQVRRSAASSGIGIMFVKVGAFKKAEEVINQARGRLSCNATITSLNPLVTLRHSAVHREKLSLLHRLTPTASRQTGIVKRICASSGATDGGFNRHYIRVFNAPNENGFNAKIEIDKQMKTGKVECKFATVKPFSDFFQRSGERELCRDFTVMKNKKRRLSLDCTPRFIFRRPALRKNRDNTNVFRVCTPIEQNPTFAARRKVGCGLRLCVNQNGEHIEDRGINILHVMTNGIFAGVAENPQRETEQETGVLRLPPLGDLKYTKTVGEIKTDEQTAKIAEYIRQITAPKTVATAAGADEKTTEFVPRAKLPKSLAVVVQTAVKANVPHEKIAAAAAQMTCTKTPKIEQTVCCNKTADPLEYFRKKGYAAKSGQAEHTTKSALQSGKLGLRERFENVIKRAARRTVIRNGGKETRVKLRREALVSPEFRELWNRIKYRKSYRISLDETDLTVRRAGKLSREARAATKTAECDTARNGVDFAETGLRAAGANGRHHALSDLILTLDDECFSARNTAVRILDKSRRVRDFPHNPQRMTEVFSKTIRRAQTAMEIDGIRYIRLDGGKYFLQEILGADGLTACLGRTRLELKTARTAILFATERPFAAALYSGPGMKIFFKIPGGLCRQRRNRGSCTSYLKPKEQPRLTGLKGFETDKIRCGEHRIAAVGLPFRKSASQSGKMLNLILNKL
jgi:restriction endonuclease